MNRRQFLRLSGVAAAAPRALATLPQALPVVAAARPAQLASGMALREWHEVVRAREDARQRRLSATKLEFLEALLAAGVIERSRMLVELQ